MTFAHAIPSAPIGAPLAVPEPRFHGVSLAQYAAVLAGLAEAHQLARVLAHEGIAPALWPDAEEAWSDQLAQNGGIGSRVQAEFDEHIAAAQDRYARRLPPLDEDLRAFLDFRRRWSTDDDPPALLARLGLRLTEVARLSRHWSTRLAVDSALAEEAQSILRGEPGELPAITPVAVELPPAPPKPDGEPAAPPIDDEDTADDERAVEEMPPFAEVSTEVAEEGPVERPADAHDAPATTDAVEPTEAVPARRQRPSFLLTKAFVAMMAKPALPFRPDAAPSAVASPSLAATAAFAVPSFAPVVPFGERRVLPVNAAMTAPVSVMPASILPFLALEAARDAAVITTAPAARPESLATTAEFEGASIAAALPFQSPEEPAAGPTGTAPMPAVTSAPEASASKPKKLSLGAYAAFCAELAAFPEQFAETFQRYGLTSPQEGLELAAAWQERFEKVPAEFDTWQRIQAFFLDHCRTKGRPEVHL